MSMRPKCGLGPLVVGLAGRTNKKQIQGSSRVVLICVLKTIVAATGLQRDKARRLTPPQATSVSDVWFEIDPRRDRLSANHLRSVRGGRIAPGSVLSGAPGGTSQRLCRLALLPKNELKSSRNVRSDCRQKPQTSVQGSSMSQSCKPAGRLRGAAAAAEPSCRCCPRLPDMESRHSRIRS